MPEPKKASCTRRSAGLPKTVVTDVLSCACLPLHATTPGRSVGPSGAVDTTFTLVRPCVRSANSSAPAPVHTGRRGRTQSAEIPSRRGRQEAAAGLQGQHLRAARGAGQRGREVRHLPHRARRPRGHPGHPPVRRHRDRQHPRPRLPLRRGLPADPGGEPPHRERRRHRAGPHAEHPGAGLPRAPRAQPAARGAGQPAARPARRRALRPAARGDVRPARTPRRQAPGRPRPSPSAPRRPLQWRR